MALTCGSPLQIIPTRSGFCSRAGTIPIGRALVTSTHATRRGRLRYEVITHYYDATFLTFGPVERVFCASAFQGRLSSCFEWDWIGHPVSRSNGVLMIPTYNDGGFRHNDGVFTFLLILSLDTAFRVALLRYFLTLFQSIHDLLPCPIKSVSSTMVNIVALSLLTLSFSISPTLARPQVETTPAQLLKKATNERFVFA